LQPPTGGDGTDGGSPGSHSGMFPQRRHPSRRPRCDWSDRSPGALRCPFDLVPAKASATFFPCELHSHSPRNKKVSPGPLPLSFQPLRGAGRSPPVHPPLSRSRWARPEKHKE
jgi:hypothetical protein